MSNQQRLQLVLRPEFEFGEVVYHRAGAGDDDYKMKGIVIEYEVYPGPQLKYVVRWADNTIGTHYSTELQNSPFDSETVDLN